MSEKKSIAVEYSKPKLSKRVLATFIDGACLILSALVLFLALFQGTIHMPVYQEAIETADDVRRQSGLYHEEEGEFTLLSDYYSEQENRIPEDDNAIYSVALDNFFRMDKGSGNEYYFFNADDGIVYYNSLKAGYPSLFTKVSDDEKDPNQYELVSSSLIDQSALRDFYEEAITKAADLLANCPDYYKSSTTMFWAALVTAVICYLISYFIWFLGVPFIFRRGYKTIGMLAANYGKVYVDGLNMTTERFLLRFFWAFLTEGIGFLALLIPVAFSIGMVYFGKFSQSLPDYLANVYPVSTVKQKIYFTPKEFKNALIEGQIISDDKLSPEAQENQRRDKDDKNIGD